MKNKTLVRATALLFVASSISFSAAAFDVCSYLGVTEMPFFCPAP